MTNHKFQHFMVIILLVVTMERKMISVSGYTMASSLTIFILQNNKADLKKQCFNFVSVMLILKFNYSVRFDNSSVRNNKILIHFILQVISQKTAACMDIHNFPYTRGTSKFLRMFDKVFNCLDVAIRYRDSTGKKELAQYTASDGWRFQVQFNHIFC